MEIAEVYEKLETLQDILSEKIKMERDIQERPRDLNKQEEVLARYKKTFIDQHQEYEKVREKEMELRAHLTEAESLREKAEKNMDLISTQREYEALDKEIRDAAEKEQQYRKDVQKQERLLAGLDEKIKLSTELINEQEAELRESRLAIEAEIGEKQIQIETLTKQQKELTAEIDPELFFKFERIIRKRGRGLESIKGGVCSGCHMILPLQFANDVRLGKEIVFCPYCSMILKYEESDQGEENYFDNDDAGSLADLDDLEEEDMEEEEEEEKVSVDFEE